MKYICVPKPIQAVSILGDALYDQDGTPVLLHFRDFILGRLVDQKFGEGLTGMDAAILGFETRNRILCELDRKDSVIALEDEQFKRLQKATAEPTGGYNPTIQHNLVPFLLAIRDATGTDPRVHKAEADPKASNGKKKRPQAQPD